MPTGRLPLVAAGVAVGVAADLPPLGTQSDERLSVHMVQHMLIGDLAAFLIAIGLTGPLLRPILTKPGIRQLRWLAHPLVAVPLWIVVYYGWHAPVLYHAAVRTRRRPRDRSTRRCSRAGLALWTGLLGPLPKPAWFGNAAGLAYVIAVRFAATVIANVFLWSSTAYYDVYVELAAAGSTRSEDQSLAGAIWMIEGSVVTICVLGWLFMRWMTQGEAAERARRARRAARRIELDPARARRAVAAGYGGAAPRSPRTAARGEQDEPDDDDRDHHHVEQEAERLRLGAQRVEHGR